MRVIETTVYKFDELNDKAKEKARDWYRNGGFDYEWWDNIFDDAKTIGELMGINIDQIYFSGFSSQGDGACFTGSYSYATGSARKLKAYAPTDAELHRIAYKLAGLQKASSYALAATIKHTGYYYHAHSTPIEVERTDEKLLNVDIDGALQVALRNFMSWIYKRLGEEWNYMNSDEQVDETIRSNEYGFTGDGERI